MCSYYRDLSRLQKRGAERQREDRGKKLKNQRAKTDGKWDRSRIYNLAVLSGFCSSSLMASGGRDCHLNWASSLQNSNCKKEEAMLNIFYLMIMHTVQSTCLICSMFSLLRQCGVPHSSILGPLPVCIITCSFIHSTFGIHPFIHLLS